MDKYISGWKEAAMLENVPLWNEGVNRHVINFSKAMLEQMNWENDVEMAVFLKLVAKTGNRDESKIAISMVFSFFNYKSIT